MSDSALELFDYATFDVSILIFVLEAAIYTPPPLSTHGHLPRLYNYYSGISIGIRRLGYVPTLSFTLHSSWTPCLYHIYYCNLQTEPEMNGQLQFIHRGRIYT